MAKSDLGPNHDLAKRITNLESAVAKLSTRDVLQNASIGAGGLTITGGGFLKVSGDAEFDGSLTVPSGSLNTGGDLSAGGKVIAGTGIVAGTTVTAGTNITAVGNISAGGSLHGDTITTSNNGHIGGILTVDGSANIGSLLTADPGISSNDIHSRVLSVGYVSVYCDSSGRLGNVPSSIRFKRDVEPVNLGPEVNAILRAALVEYRYDAAVEEYGDDAPTERGMIAEYAEAIGLGAYVSRDADGEVHGINYERLVIPLIATVQALNARLSALEHKNGATPD